MMTTVRKITIIASLIEENIIDLLIFISVIKVYLKDKK